MGEVGASSRLSVQGKIGSTLGLHAGTKFQNFNSRIISRYKKCAVTSPATCFCENEPVVKGNE